MNPRPLPAMQSHLPDGVASDRFDIQAKTLKPTLTKDEIRMLMRALLADKFKLVMRTETQEAIE